MEKKIIVRDRLRYGVMVDASTQRVLWASHYPRKWHVIAGTKSLELFHKLIEEEWKNNQNN